MKRLLWGAFVALTGVFFTLNSNAQCHKGVILDGVNEYLHSPFNDYNFSNFTFETWINVPTYIDNVHYISLYQNAYLVLGDYGIGNFETWASGLSPIAMSVPATPPVNSWVHLAFTFDGTDQKMYINGVLADTDPTTGSVILDNLSHNQGLVIGARYSTINQFAEGMISDVRIWTVARTASEISTNMNSTLSGSETGLVAYYDFSDGPGSTIVTDMTGNGNTLTLYNMEPATDWFSSGPTASGTDVQTSCGPYLWIDGITYTSSNNTAMWTINGGAANGCDSIVTLNLTIEDLIPPTAVCQNFTVNLDAAGNASMVASDIDGGSTDDCGPVTISASQTTFTCDDLGPNNIILTVTDGSGNSSTCVAVVTVVDLIDPTIFCTGNITQEVDPTGTCSATVIYPLPIVSDNCGIGGNVLLIYDENPHVGTQALVSALQAAGMNVTLSSVPEYQYDGTNPSPTGFDAVIHLNGTLAAYSADMPLAGQTALVNYAINDGGTYISHEWMAWEAATASHYANMNDLILLEYAGYTYSTYSYDVVPAFSSHPLMDNLPASFSLPYTGHNAGPAKTYTSNQPYTLATSPNGAAVVMRDFVSGGKAVSFQHSGNELSPSALLDSNVLRLFINAARLGGGSSIGPANILQTAGLPSGSAFPVGLTTNTFVVTDNSGNTATCSFDVTVTNSTAMGTDTQIACGPYTWIDGNTYTSSNNTATHTIVAGAASGCDSTATLDLTIFVVGTVANVSATNITTSTADVTWDPMTLPAGGFFSIQYQVMPSGPWISGGTVPAGSTMTSLSGLTPGTNYAVQVAGNCDPSNAGPWSTSAMFATSSAACNTPINMSVVSNNGNAITVSWPAIPASGWYEFRYKLSSSSTWLFGGTLGAAATSKIFSGLSPNTSYDFQARTFCPNGVLGPWSTTLTATTNPLAGCSLPPAVAASTITGYSATISWPAVSGAAYYAFRYKEASATTWISGGTAGSTATNKTYSGLTPNTAYDFEGRTICANGVSSAWGATAFTTSALSGCELPPSTFNTVSFDPNSVELSWIPVSGAGWYGIQYKASSSSVWLSAGTVGPNVGVSGFIIRLVNGLSPSTSYDFRIRTFCPNGVASAYGAPGSQTTISGGSSTIVVNDKIDLNPDKALAAKNHVTTVYPNPSTDKVNIDIFMTAESDNTSIKLMDMSGRLVREISVSTVAGLNTLTLDVQDLSNGMYTLMVYQNGQLLHTDKVKKN